MKSVVLVGAHPDDVELGAGGTCARLAANGWDVRIVVMTDEADAAISARRRREAIAAAALLGVNTHNVRFLGLPDGAVSCDRASVGALRALVAEMGVAPVAVFTHSEADSHQDHIAVTRIVKAAFRSTAILKYAVRNSAIVSSFAPTLRCAIDAEFPTKVAALLKHESQVHAGRIPLDKVERFAADFARHGGLAEAFEVEMQEGAAHALDLLHEIDHSPFARLWGPLVGEARLTILVGTADDVAHNRAPLSELLFIARLQAALMALPRPAWGAGGPCIEIATGGAGALGRHGREGHVLVLPSAARDAHVAQDLADCGAFGPNGLALHVHMPAGEGLLAAARSPIAAVAGRHAMLLALKGADAAGEAAAALRLVDETLIGEVLPVVLGVIAGERTRGVVAVAPRSTSQAARPQIAGAVAASAPTGERQRRARRA